MPIRVIDYHSQNAPAEFAAGLKEIGFAVIANHPISQSLVDEAYKKWDVFFKLDEHEKLKYAYDKETQDGFFSKQISEIAKGYDQKDIKEYFHYYEGKRCPPGCFSVTSTLAKELTTMAATLLRWVDENAPAEVRKKFSIPLPKMIENSQHILFRILHYPPLTGNEPAGAIRAAAHEDINLITLLPAATAEGLQVLDAQGNWLNVPINPGWIIVNAGDMLQECSEHYYISTKHRVLNPTGESAKKSRLSMPLFLHPRSDVMLSSRYTAESYLNERLQELGVK